MQLWIHTRGPSRNMSAKLMMKMPETYEHSYRYLFIYKYMLNLFMTLKQQRQQNKPKFRTRIIFYTSCQYLMLLQSTDFIGKGFKNMVIFYWYVGDILISFDRSIRDGSQNRKKMLHFISIFCCCLKKKKLYSELRKQLSLLK